VNSDASFGASIEISRDLSVNGTIHSSIISLGGHIIPTLDASFDIGSSTRQIRDIYLSQSTLFMGTGSIGESIPVLKLTDGVPEFTGKVIAPIGISTITKLDGLEVGGDTSFNENVDISKQLVVGGDVSLNSSLDISNNLYVGEQVIAFKSLTTPSLIMGATNINEIDLEKIDNISNGIISSSKAVVVDDNKNIGGFNLLSAITLSGENINIKGKDLYHILDFFLELDSFTS
jgi:hypothetical protein